MAINPETLFSGKINPADSDYPYGSARNVTVTGDGTGTPFVADLVNDIFGFQQALLTASGITASGSPETAVASQYLASIRGILAPYTPLTTNLVNSEDATLAVGTVVITGGYGAVDDAGGASWIKTNVTGAVSQTPKQLSECALHDGLGNKWEIVQESQVTFSQIGGVSGQNETALLTAILAKTKLAEALPVYIIDATVTYARKALYMDYCTLKAAPGFTSDTPVLLIDGDGSSAVQMRPPSDTNVVIEGNGVFDYPTFTTEPTCNGVVLEANRSQSDRFNFYVSNCLNGVILDGDNERKAEINIYASACDTALRMIQDNADPDECRINITAGYCRTWLHSSQGEENAHYHFNVENNNADDAASNPDRWGVILGGGKNITVGGVIRGHNGNLLKVYRLNDGDTTARDAVHFDNLTVIQCDDGVAFVARRIDRLKGTVNLYDCQNDSGPTAIIDDVVESPNLLVIIDKCFSETGLVIGEFAPMKNTYFPISVSMGDRYDTNPSNLQALWVKNAVNCNYDCKILKGNVDITGASDCVFNINKSFVTKAYTLTGGATSFIKLAGNYSSLELSKISWLDEVKSVHIESFEDTGAGLIYSNGLWQSVVQLTATATDLGNKNATINRILKKEGTTAYNTTDQKTYVAGGNDKTSVWTPTDGGTAITPTFSSEMTSFEARLPTAISGTAKENYDRLFALLATADLLSTFSHLYVLASTSEDNGLINLSANTDILTKTGDVAHVADLGFSSASSNGTGYLSGVTTTPAVTDMTMGLYVSDPYDSDSERDIEDGSTKVTLRAKAGDGGYVEFGSEDVLTFSQSSDPERLIHGVRSGNVQTVYSDGVFQNSVTVVESTYFTGVLTLARTTRNASIFFLGDAITVTQSAQLSAAVQEYIYLSRI